MKKEQLIKFLKNFRLKYRFIVRHEDSLEVRTSFRLSRFNVVMFSSILIVGLFTLIFFIIAWTPLKEYIPGYADFNTRKEITKLILETDSLQQKIINNERYLTNLKNILSDSVMQYSKDTYKKADSLTISSNIRALTKSKADSLLRKEFEEDEGYNVYYQESGSMESNLKNFVFFSPVSGVVSEKFNTNSGHYGVDVASSPNVGIKAVLEGTVIYTDWNINTGYVIVIQHKNNLSSVYMHNSTLLKKVGNFVRSGEVIAIIGETGQYSHGPHLHFELWYDGMAVDPEKYMVF